MRHNHDREFAVLHDITCKRVAVVTVQDEVSFEKLCFSGQQILSQVEGVSKCDLEMDFYRNLITHDVARKVLEQITYGKIIPSVFQ